MPQNQKYDVVIIGGGLGGLVCANILAKNRKKVCLLEKEKNIGGNLQTFRRNACLFDTGMHYFGSYDPGQPIYQMFRYLDLIGKFEVQRLNEDGFDTISIGEKEFLIPMGYGNFLAAMKEYFPGEEKAIDTFVSKVREISSKVNTFDFLQEEQDKFSFVFSYMESAYEFLESLTENKLLKAVLAGNNGRYCGNSLKTPISLLAHTNNFYMESAYRLIGGGHQLANAIAENIQRYGGSIFTGKKVNKLGFGGKKVIFAQTIEDEIFEADSFISNVHPAVSLDWIEPGKFTKAYTERIRKIENTPGAFVLYLVLEKNSINHRNGNLYYSEDENVWDMNRNLDQPWPHGFMLYTTRDGHKDYAESMTVITMMDFKEVAAWDNTVTGKRGPSYESFKAQKINDMLRVVEKKLPEIKGKVKHTYAATPLTFRDYTATVGGSMYGIEHNYNDAMGTLITPKTRIPNFFFTGQNIGNHGMLGVTLGALITCISFVDIQAVIKEIKQG